MRRRFEDRCNSTPGKQARRSQACPILGHITSPEFWYRHDCFMYLRIGIVGARPCSRASSLIIVVDNYNNRDVGTCNHKKETNQYNKNTPCHHEIPAGCPLALVFSPVVIKPHASHGLERHQCRKKGTDQRHKTVEDGNGTGNDVGDNGGSKRATDPDCPVLNGVRSQMPTVSQQTDEDVLAR